MQNLPRPVYAIGSVDNALRLLELTAEHETVGVSEGAGALGVARSTAHRLLTTLEYRGFVERDPSGRAYRIGPAIDRLKPRALDEADLTARARPLLEALANDTGESANLMVLEGARVRFLLSVEGPQVLRVGSRTGVLLPAHCTSGGKALLARLGPAELRRRYPHHTLPTLTPRSIASRKVLEQELATVRSRGYGINIAESEAHVAAVGCTVNTDATTRPLAIAVSAPISRAPEKRHGELGAACSTAAAQLVYTLA